LPALPPENIELSNYFQLFIPKTFQDNSVKKIIKNMNNSLKDITLKDIL